MVHLSIIGSVYEFDENYVLEKKHRGVSVRREIPNNIFYEGVPFDAVQKMKDGDDVLNGMRVNVEDGLSPCTFFEFKVHKVIIQNDDTFNIDDVSFDDSDDDTSHDDSDDDASCDDDDNDWNSIDWNFKITYEFDKHYDCYYKTRKVCGCGCDPLHDGW